MTTYVALLRGINVGGNKTVSMAQLKVCFEKLGFSNIRTYINSGNVIFQTKPTPDDKLIKQIEACLAKQFGFAIRVVVRQQSEIETICKKIPAKWTNDAQMRTDVIFLWPEVDNKKSVAEIKTTPKVDTLVYVKGCVIWHFDRKDYKKSAMHQFIGTHVYKNMTARNVNTVRKLRDLMAG